MRAQSVLRVAERGDVACLLTLAEGRPVWSEPFVREAIDAAAYRIVLVEVRKRLAGAIWLNVSAPMIDVVDVVVAAPYRNQGCGQALLRACLQWAQNEGFEGILLDVAENNRAALALYRRVGFVVLGRRPGYYGAGPDAQDALTMRIQWDAGCPAPH